MYTAGSAISGMTILLNIAVNHLKYEQIGLKHVVFNGTVEPKVDTINISKGSAVHEDPVSHILQPTKISSSHDMEHHQIADWKDYLPLSRNAQLSVCKSHDELLNNNCLSQYVG